MRHRASCAADDYTLDFVATITVFTMPAVGGTFNRDQSLRVREFSQDATTDLRTGFTLSELITRHHGISVLEILGRNVTVNIDGMPDVNYQVDHSQFSTEVERAREDH